MQAVHARSTREVADAHSRLEAAARTEAAMAHELEEARGVEATLRAEVGGLRESDEGTKADLAACKRDAAEGTSQLRAALERCDVSERHAASLSTQQEAMQAQLAALQSRHHEQLTRERDAHDEATRALHEQLLDARDAATSPPAAGDSASPSSLTARAVAGGVESGMLASTRSMIVVAVEEARAYIREKAATSSCAGSRTHAAEAPSSLRTPMPSSRVNGQPRSTDGASINLDFGQGADSHTSSSIAAGGMPDGGVASGTVAGGMSVDEPLLDGLRALLLQHNTLLGGALRRNDALQIECTRHKQRVAMLEPAIERHAVERDVGARQLHALQRALSERNGYNDGALALALRHADSRLDALTFELERAREAGARKEKRIAIISHELEVMRSGLLASAESIHANASAADAATVGTSRGAESAGGRSTDGSRGVDVALERASQLDESAERTAESEERVRSFLEQRVLRGVLNASELPARVLNLMHELTAQVRHPRQRLPA